MVTVSVNAFQDAHLLEYCLRSVREHIPDARIQVIDGRYERFDAESDNSTDDTPAVAERYGAEYYADGPHEDEPAKHWQRVERAPDGERCLFMDADERLVAFDASDFEDHEIYLIRIHNAACYNGDVSYYARYFYPEQMDDIPRVDRFWFGDTPETTEQRTDDITLVHRADRRGSDYRQAKNERLEQAGRDWYDAYLDEFDEHDLDFDTCPECGEDSLRRSMVCGYRREDDFTRVETCVNGECYAAVVSVDGPDLPEEWLYVPNNLDEGFEEDIERVRMELMAAGNPVARLVSGEAFKRYKANAKVWVREEYLGDGLSQAK